MKRTGKSLYSAAALAAMALFMGGCATSRGILDVRVDVPENPSSGKAVSIVRVVDNRHFEEAPRDASIPSLKDRDIGNRALTSRAIARKRNTYGKALGDVLLPEGRTVEGLVKEALTRSFREAGYRVVDNAGGSGEGAPIEAEIEQLWGWITPGFWSASLQFEAKVRIKGDVQPFQEGKTVRGYVLLHTQGAGSGQWLNTFNKGLDSLVQEVKNELTTR
ncbi:MAG TPA: flagellar biosynthesis protein [Nitrospirota bacterium]|nr:flagellar biosynthesis protein [Nitrospirota bacterium]